MAAEAESVCLGVLEDYARARPETVVRDSRPRCQPSASGDRIVPGWIRFLG